MHFGRVLQRLRKSQGLSQERLAERAEVSTKHVSALECGRAMPTREMALALGHALDLSMHAQNGLLEAAEFRPMSEPDVASADELKRLRERLSRPSRTPILAMRRDWTLIDANETAVALATLVLQTPMRRELLVGQNALPLFLGPRTRMIENVVRLRQHMAMRVDREGLFVDDGHEALAMLRATLGHGIEKATAPPSLGELHIRTSEGLLSWFTHLTTLGAGPREGDVRIYTCEASNALAERWADAQVSAQPPQGFMVYAAGP